VSDPTYAARRAFVEQRIGQGAALVIPAALALGTVGGHVVVGVAVLFLFVLGFEFAIVSFIPLITEVVPGARAASLGTAAGFGTAGRGLAALVSTSLYTHIGVGASGVVSAICAAGALTLLALFVHEPPANATAGRSRAAKAS